MKNFTHILLAATLVFAGGVLFETLSPSIASATAVNNCGSCGKARCGCLQKRRAAAPCNSGCCGQACNSCTQCPSCQADFCELKTSAGKDEKSCFKVEQKQVCVPAIRLPWQKCCPPNRSKTRTVNVLKKHKYKCPSCKYAWSVYEPPAPQVAPQPQVPVFEQPIQQPGFAPKFTPANQNESGSFAPVVIPEPAPLSFEGTR